MFGWFKKKAPSEPSRSTLVARIKHTNMLAALRDMDIPEDQLPLTEPLVGDLLIAYAFDLPGMFQMASAGDLKELGIAKSEARAVAISNLKKQLPEINAVEEGPLLRIVTGDNLEAIVLLADSFWDELTEVPPEIIAAVPSRDDFLFCSSQSPADVEVLQAAATEIHMEAGTHALSDRLLVWRNHRWMLYQS